MVTFSRLILLGSLPVIVDTESPKQSTLVMFPKELKSLVKELSLFCAQTTFRMQWQPAVLNATEQTGKSTSLTTWCLLATRVCLH